MACERCGAEDGSVQVQVRLGGDAVDLMLCPICVMVEAHRNVKTLPPDLGGEADERPMA